MHHVIVSPQVKYVGREEVTFLSDGAPDGDDEHTYDSEDQQSQDAPDHCIRNGTVGFHHCSRVWDTHKHREKSFSFGIWTKNKSIQKWLVKTKKKTEMWLKHPVILLLGFFCEC